jgi:hypothetical protein
VLVAGSREREKEIWIAGNPWPLLEIFVTRRRTLRRRNHGGLLPLAVTAREHDSDSDLPARGCHDHALCLWSDLIGSRGRRV